MDLADTLDKLYTARLPPSKRGSTPHDGDVPPSPVDAQAHAADRMEVLADLNPAMDSLNLTAQLTRESTRRPDLRTDNHTEPPTAGKGLIIVEDGKKYYQSLFKALYKAVAGEVWVSIAMIGTSCKQTTDQY